MQAALAMALGLPITYTSFCLIMYLSKPSGLRRVYVSVNMLSKVGEHALAISIFQRVHEMLLRSNHISYIALPVS